MSIRISSKRSHVIAVMSIGVTALGKLAVAEPISMDPKAEPATLIEFKAEPKLGEFVGRAEGTVDSGGKRYYLKGLNVMSPLAIQVFAKDAAKPVDISMHRFMWHEANREGRTNENGNWGYTGRVHDEVGIALSAEDPAEFYILAWMGPELPTARQASLFVPAGPGTGSVDGSVDAMSSAVPAWALIAIIVLLAVIAMILFRNRASRSSTAATVMMAALALLHAGQAGASDPFAARLARAEENIRILYEDTTQAMNDLERLRVIEERKFEITHQELDQLKTRVSAIYYGLTLVEQDVYFQGEEIARNRDEIMRLQSDMDDAKLRQRLLNEGFFSDIQQLYLLVEQDRAAEPDPTFGGIAPMPSSCFAHSSISPRLGIGTTVTTTEDYSACAECFDAANERLVARMENYEKMRAIYATYRSYAEYVVMTGDAFSGFHQLEQAYWYKVKLQIKESQMNVTRAYNAKFAEFNRDLDEILREFGRCEAMNGDDSWYQRHGVIFYNSLINSYRVHDDTQLPF